MSSIERQSEKVWRSLEELAGQSDAPPPGDEFAEGAFSPPDGPSRRRFLQLMAASAGLAGMAGCRWPKENILPYARRPPEITPGEPLHFATSMDISGRVQGLLVTSYDGRPIKVEGNPLHPINQGTTDVFAQASILDVYDPDRSKNPVQVEGAGQGRSSFFDRNWNDFDRLVRQHFSQVRQAGGRGLYVLSEASSSPSMADMRARFSRAYPQARWCEYEPVGQENERAGAILALGQPYRTHARLDQARVVVALDSDFVMVHPAALRYARDFMQGHTPRAENNWTMSRLYAVEPAYSNTGAMADERLAVPASQVWGVASELAGMLAEGGLRSPVLSAEMVQAVRASRADGAPGTEAFVRAMARDLLEHRGESVILVGEGQPAEVHALGHVLNAALGNVGKTVWYSVQPQEQPPSIGLQALVRDMAEGRVETLLILGGNPVYNAPADLDFAVHLARVKTSIHLSMYWDETSRLCTWHVPRAHYLEAWSDARAYDGTVSAAQPLIAPLYEGRSAIEMLSWLSEEPALSGYQIVRRTMREQFAGEVTDEQFEEFWRKLLNDGVLDKTGLEPVEAEIQAAGVAPRLRDFRPGAYPAADRLEVVFRDDSKVFDGRFANNSWLQELPETLTKVVWDNAALISPETAAAVRVGHQQIVRMALHGRQVTAPVYVLPGVAPFTVVVHLGYGRKAAGKVGNNVGFDAYALRTTEAMHFGQGLEIARTGRRYAFAMTQDHWRIDRVGQEGKAARLEEIAPELSLAAWKKDPDFAKEQVHQATSGSLWKEYEYNGYKWGMAIDMHKCIGCNACVIACQAENNVPVVGRDQVRRGREMQWLRIDRYFRGEPGAPAVTFQPMFCVHCENAPCESVCPVGATLHDGDGLNLMVYNRCVGTRYCSNNCPYKVRRFNFFHYTKDISRLEAMQKNPDVTVRSRGVMEKCTYCLQRIQRAKIAAKNERRGIRDGEFTTACAQACPTGAIVFGDLNDPNSAAARLQRQSRAYGVLAEINTRPRSLHMMRVRNAHPGLGNSHGNGLATDRHG